MEFDENVNKNAEDYDLVKKFNTEYDDIFLI